jgi:outer membrane protein OmpA-like peptidoglycan-associated protein
LTDEHYEVEVDARSVVLSASARYTPGWWRGTLWEGLHILAGIDARFLWSARERVRQVFRYAERVEEWRLQQDQPLPMWLGVHLGVGLDMIVALFGERLRNYITPMVVLQTGLPLQRTWGSTWTPLALHAGLTFKLGWERVREQLLPWDTTAGPFLAGSSELGPGGVPRLLREERLPPAPLAVLETPQAETPPEESPTPPPTSRIAIVPNRIQRFSYPTSTAVGITPELQRFLDALVEYLRANPQAEVRIVGHTDEFGGTLEETQYISEQRAQQVVEYLVRRGISRSRLFASGVGARQPIADNRTPEGRLRNRRVEIVVVQ